MNIDSLKALHGEDGAVAIVGGVFDQTDLKQAQVVQKRNSFANELLTKNMTVTMLNDSARKFAGMIDKMPDGPLRMAAFTNIRRMILAAASKTIVADTFAKSMMKAGYDIRASKFLDPEPLMIGDYAMYNDSILMSKKEGVSLINNIRNELSEIFVDPLGNPTSESAKSIQALMKPVEASMNKYGLVTAVSTALIELAAPMTEKLTQKFEQFKVGAGLAQEKENAKTLSRNNNLKM